MEGTSSRYYLVSVQLKREGDDRLNLGRPSIEKVACNAQMIRAENNLFWSAKNGNKLEEFTL
jgi:hypothetical protein